MASVKELSEVNMISLVREVLQGKDLSKVTARTVREEVASILGSETIDAAALKASVKSALDVVLTDNMHCQQKRGANKPPVQRKVDTDDPPEEQSYDENVDNGSAYREEDYEFSAKRNEKESSEESEDSDIEPVQPSKGTAKKVNSGAPSRPQKRARTTGGNDCPFYSEEDFNRLKRVCRQIGCPVPPSRQKGSNMREKCSNVLGFLRSKGVMDRDPIRLRKEEISAHRKRIEREKDLEGLDVSNIIEEEGRPRRRRASVQSVKNEDLPSDFSGPELSDKSVDEGEEYAISDAESV